MNKSPMLRRVKVEFDSLRIGDTIQYHDKRGVSAGKVSFITFKETGKVESFRVDHDTSNYFKLAYIRAWTYVPHSDIFAPRFHPEHNYTVDDTLFKGYNNVEMVEVSVDNEEFESKLKKNQILAMLDACQNSGVELRSAGMNIYDVLYALYEAGFRK